MAGDFRLTPADREKIIGGHALQKKKLGCIPAIARR
jgi:hypothetical protein